MGTVDPKSVAPEIKDDATREDVDAMVKEFMQEREELTGEAGAGDDDAFEKDGAGEAGAEDTSKQTPGGDDDSAADDAASGQEAGADDAAQDDESGQDEKTWLTDEVRAELPRWVSDEELSEFSSRDELDRAIALMDRRALKAGQEAAERGDEADQGSDDSAQRGQARGRDGKFIKQQKEEAPGAKDGPKPYEVDLDLSDFDDDLDKKIKGALTGLRDHYEERLKSLDDRFAAMEAESRDREVEAIENRFDAAVDSLNAPELFGVTGKESEEHAGLRRKLFDDAWSLVNGHQSQFGHEITLEEATARMYRALFHDHISKQEQKSLTKRYMEQSSMRTGVGAERPAEQEFKGPLKKHPDVQRAYKAVQEARGEE
jgi:hypothetical protein